MIPAPRFRLFDYYLVEALTATGVTLFVNSLYFWTQRFRGYSHADNLLLSMVFGLAYVPMAWWGGRLADRSGYDRMIRRALFLLAALLVCGLWTVAWRGLPFILLAGYVGSMALLWPAIEGAVAHRPSNRSLANRVGLYNLTWATGNAFGFFIGGAVFAWSPNAIFWVAGLIHAATWLRWLRPPRRITVVEAAPIVAPPSTPIPLERKRFFMRMGWTANALSYVLQGVLLALTPLLAERLALTPEYAMWLTCSFFVARGLAFALFRSWSGWHYHAGWSLLALWLAPLAMLGMFLTSSVSIALGLLVLFGFTIGLSYYASIYYSLDFGQTKGALGGLHEAILGVGQVFGPLLGFLGERLFGFPRAAVFTVVGFTLLINAMAPVLCARIRPRPAGDPERAPET